MEWREWFPARCPLFHFFKKKWGRGGWLWLLAQLNSILSPSIPSPISLFFNKSIFNGWLCEWNEQEEKNGQTSRNEGRVVFRNEVVVRQRGGAHNPPHQPMKPAKEIPFNSASSISPILLTSLRLPCLFSSLAPAKTGSPIPFFSSLMSEIKEELSWWNGLLLRWKLITHYRGIWKTCFSMKRAAEDSHSTTSFRNKNNFLLRPLKRKVYFYLLHFTCGMRENKNIL